MFILPSGKPKRWDQSPNAGPLPADQAYTGTFHRLCRDYALHFREEYLILSPFYGFLKPDEWIPHGYDVRFTQKGTTPFTISIQELREQWHELAVPDQETITVLGGKKFKPLLESITQDHSHLVYPLIGLGGIGYMQSALKNAIRTDSPLYKKEADSTVDG